MLYYVNTFNLINSLIYTQGCKIKEIAKKRTHFQFDKMKIMEADNTLKYYWINEEGVPVDIESILETYLRNVLRLIISEARLRAKYQDVTIFKIRKSIFLAPLSHCKGYIIWCILLYVFQMISKSIKVALNAIGGNQLLSERKAINYQK